MMTRMGVDHSGRSNLGIFELAARYVSGDRDFEPALHAKVEGFLRAFDYQFVDETVAGMPAVAANRIALLQAAAKIGGIFRLRSRNAPGLIFFGAKAELPDGGATSSASVVGAGKTARQAFEACIGEAVEYLSQLRRDGDGVEAGLFDRGRTWGDARLFEHLADWMGIGIAERPAPVDWIEARRLHDDTAGWLPADLVLRGRTGRAQQEQRYALGTGCAAGPTWTAAVTSALFEILERDAVAMWWAGGGNASPVALESLASLGIPDFLASVRRDSSERTTTILVLPGAAATPCIAAISFDQAGGGFAGGYACHLDAGRACRSAIIEMCQMELGHDVVAVKRAKLGPEGLNDADLRQERRRYEMSANRVDLFRGLLSPALLPLGRSEDCLSEAVDRLAASGFHVYAVDLTRADFGIPVARVIVPGLQPYPSSYIGPRLEAAKAELLQKSFPDSPADSIDLF